MTRDDSSKLSEAAANVVENLACRIAERRGGRLCVHHLMPYLPMSLDLIRATLDSMVDGTSVLSDDSGDFAEYEFAAYRGSAVQDGMLQVERCVSCEGDLKGDAGQGLCSSCDDTLRGELNRLAERIGWPAQAVYEHEILHLASLEEQPVHAESLSGHSRYTLSNMRRKLDRMSVSGYVRQELDDKEGTVRYRFPDIEYPREHYRKNMQVIRRYPASLTEEIELKAVRIIIALALLLLGLFVLGFVFYVPLPILAAGFLVLGPAASVMIWRRKDRPEDD